jgi:hypothetical protein
MTVCSHSLSSFALPLPRCLFSLLRSLPKALNYLSPRLPPAVLCHLFARSISAPPTPGVSVRLGSENSVLLEHATIGEERNYQNAE